MKRMMVLFGLAFAYSLPLYAQALSAQEAVQKSIAYHGMADWYEQHHRLTLNEIRPNGSNRQTRIDLRVGGGFALQSAREAGLVEASLAGDECKATIDGSAEIADELKEQYRISCEGLRWWHSYYGYLYGLPLKITDPGTQLEKDVQTTTFQGQKVLALKVTYDAEVGTDTWYYYLDPATYALVGCRFYHDESKNDGEYIVFEGEVVHEGLRLPKTRRWYINADSTYLGADVIEAYTRLAPDGP